MRLNQRHHNFVKYTFAATARLFLLAYYQMVGYWRGMNYCPDLRAVRIAMCGHP